KALEQQLTEVENQMRDRAGADAVVKAGKGVAWKWAPTGKFSDKSFRENYPDLVDEYTTTVEVIDSARLKAEKPEIHTKCRARVLPVPAKGICSMSTDLRARVRAAAAGTPSGAGRPAGADADEAPAATVPTAPGSAETVEALHTWLTRYEGHI